MKILMVCAGGFSSSIVMKKIIKYGKDTGNEILIDAFGFNEVADKWQNYDCILVAPQVRNRIREIEQVCGIPVAAIAPQDYGVGNAANIVKLAKTII